MSRKRFATLIVVQMILFIVQHILIKQPGIISHLKASGKYTDVEITLVDGGFEPLGYYQNKQPVVLVFWSSECDPCRLLMHGLMTRLEGWHKEYEFLLVAVNVGEAREVVEKARVEWNIETKIGLDEKRALAQQFGISALPTVIFIKKDGSIGKSSDRYDPDLFSSLHHRIKIEISGEEEDDSDVDSAQTDSLKAGIPMDSTALESDKEGERENE